jgi:hypothetical protein
MKIVIQNPKNLYYLTAEGTWSAESSQALVFDNFRVAVEYFSDHKLCDVRIVLPGEEDAEGLRLDRTPPLTALSEGFFRHPALIARGPAGSEASSAASSAA